MSGRHLMESTLRGFGDAVSHALIAERTAREPGFLQQFDPRVRVIGILALVISVALCRRIPTVAVLFAIATALAIASRIGVVSLAKRVWLVVLGFTALIALPALFVTPGDRWFEIPALHLSISYQGLRSVALLILRVETAATLTTLMVLCTRWDHVLKALRSLRLPAEVVAMLAMTHRYVFLLIETANQMFESRQSRMVGILNGKQRREMTARTAGVLLSKSIELSHEVYLAMISRGFRGEIHLLHDFRMRARDYAGLTAFLCGGALAAWLGR